MDTKETDYIFKIAGIDPGTATLGLAYISVDIRDNTIVAIDAETVTSKHLLHNDLSQTKTMSQTSERHHNVRQQGKYLLQSFTYHTPRVVVYEHPFINTRRPMAYGALIEIVECIRNAVSTYHPEIAIVHYSPITIKQAVDARRLKGKDAVLQGMLDIKEITSRIDLNNLSEHAIDAIGAAYTYLKDYRDNNL